QAAAVVPFVGREAELELLSDAAQRAANGTAMLALIVGSPGLGKSRLAEEAIQRLSAARPVRHIVVRCRPGAEVGANTPLRQMIEADVPDANPGSVLDRAAHLLGQDDAATVATAI